MHNLYIRVRKDPSRAWVKLSFIATDDENFEVMVSWSPQWHAPDLAELEKIGAQQRKRETNLRIVKLVERKRQEQEATTQQKASEAIEIEQMEQTTTTTTEETKEGREIST